MIVHVSMPVPDSWVVGPETKIEVGPGAEVRDPARGIIGSLLGAHLNWRGGNAEIHYQLRIDDDSAVAAALRSGPIF